MKIEYKTPSEPNVAEMPSGTYYLGDLSFALYEEDYTDVFQQSDVGYERDKNHSFFLYAIQDSQRGVEMATMYDNGVYDGFDEEDHGKVGPFRAPSRFIGAWPWEHTAFGDDVPEDVSGEKIHFMEDWTAKYYPEEGIMDFGGIIIHTKYDDSYEEELEEF